MLVLTRKRDGVIRIGNDIVIRVIRTGKSSVKIGVEAPSDVRVVRGELGPLPDHDDDIDLDAALLELATSH
ncbi:carbon storage regulator [bacterium]|nr:carbon storage regulator [bacterium]